MKELLQALQTRIAAQVTGLGGTKAVHFLADENILPETTSFPCVGLKDGNVNQHYYLGMARQKADLQVDVISYVELSTYETLIEGKGAQLGILDLNDLVRASLEGYEPAGYRWVNGDVPETASQSVFADEEGDYGTRLQKKKFSMKWEKG